MTNWMDMRRPQFTADGLSKRERAVVETAGDSLFPDLMPEAKPGKPAAAADPPGTESLFGDDL